MTRYLMVALGGALGSCLRYWLGGAVSARFPLGSFPAGTFLINVTGSFVIGFFLTVATERLSLDPNWRLFFAVGFLGGYTTFSTFEYEAIKLLEARESTMALFYLAGSLVAGLVAVWLGVGAGRLVEGTVPLKDGVSGVVERTESPAGAIPGPRASTGLDGADAGPRGAEFDETSNRRRAESGDEPLPEHER